MGSKTYVCGVFVEQLLKRLEVLEVPKQINFEAFALTRDKSLKVFKASQHSKWCWGSATKLAVLCSPSRRSWASSSRSSEDLNNKR